ncbi:MAG: outer membrane protein assembly factor BamC [Gallionellaceae bacterium]|nr:outer membrane protein assembly factor BamC [Gallionellaceae bacterium]
MKIRNIAGLTFALLALAACSLDKKRIDYKVASSRVPTLEVPPDLTTISANEQYAIPGGDGELAANYSDYSKSIAAQPAKGTVLPDPKNVRLERNGNQRWLVVNGKAENVWPLVKSFWIEMGFDIQVDNPQAGVIQTDWQENRSNVPQHFTRGILANGKVLDSLKPIGQRDQYLTRLERSKDGANTDVYLSRQVLEEMQVFGRKDTKWLPHAGDSEIEIAVLQMMMVKLNDAAQPTNNTVVAPVVAAPINVQLLEVSGNKVLQLNEPFDKSWRKVGLALDKARIAVEDKDRSKGLYLLRPATTEKSKKTNNYQIIVRDNGTQCEVSARNSDGNSDKESLRLIEALFQNIEK